MEDAAVAAAREGLEVGGERPEEADFPPRFYEEGVETGPAAGKRLDRRKVRETLREYYRARGWDEETGAPTPEKLAELGL